MVVDPVRDPRDRPQRCRAHRQRLHGHPRVDMPSVPRCPHNDAREEQQVQNRDGSRPRDHAPNDEPPLRKRQPRVEDTSQRARPRVERLEQRSSARRLTGELPHRAHIAGRPAQLFDEGEEPKRRQHPRGAIRLCLQPRPLLRGCTNRSTPDCRRHECRGDRHQRKRRDVGLENEDATARRGEQPDLARRHGGADHNNGGGRTMVAWAFHELRTKPGTRAMYNANNAVNATVRAGPARRSAPTPRRPARRRLIASAPAARPDVRDPAAA